MALIKSYRLARLADREGTLETDSRPGGVDPVDKKFI
jgi:hypothetical protein